jgi:hypothetical protein
MSAVYLAEDLRLKRRVALKLLATGRAEDFLGEIQLRLLTLYLGSTLQEGARR